MKTERRTSNVEHRTLKLQKDPLFSSTFNVQRSTFDVRMSDPREETRLMRGLRQFIRHSSFIFVTLFLCSCGYQQTGVDNANNTPGYQWHSLYRQDIQTVAVPIFINRTYRRGLETELTKSVIQQMEEHTPYKVVAKERADTILDCEIVDAHTNTLSTDIQTGLPQEQLYTITVSFTWKNLRTGEILVQRKNFDQRTNFVPFLGESASVGSTNAIQQLALGIVQELRADW